MIIGVVVFLIIVGWMRYNKNERTVGISGMCALQCVAMEYLEHTGQPPSTVEDLLLAELLVELPNSDYAARHLGGELFRVVPIAVVQNALFSYPQTTDEYEYRDGRVVRRGTEEALEVIHVNSLPSRVLRYYNRRFALEWFQLAQGQRKANTWVDESLQPASAPS